MSRYNINYEIVNMMKWTMKTWLKSHEKINRACFINSLCYAWDELVEEGEIVLED